MPSVTRPKRATKDRREAVEHQVLEAVERLLADGESFTALGVGRIADAAGIGRSSFYGYFADKTTLLMRLIESATENLFSVASAWVQDDASTREQLDGVVLELIGERREHAPLIGAVMEVGGYEPAVAAFWRDLINGFADQLRRRLERDRESGRMLVDIDPAAAASWIAWGTERAVGIHVETQDRASDPAFASGVAGATWAAMGRGGRPKRVPAG